MDDNVSKLYKALTGGEASFENLRGAFGAPGYKGTVDQQKKIYDELIRTAKTDGGDFAGRLAGAGINYAPGDYSGISAYAGNNPALNNKDYIDPYEVKGADLAVQQASLRGAGSDELNRIQANYKEPVASKINSSYNTLNTPASGLTAQMRSKMTPQQITDYYNKIDPQKNKSIQTTTPTFSLTSGNLQSGSSGTNVSQLQTLLGGLNVDGKFGPKTQAAVMAFQKANGLTPDGIVGPNTVAMLNAKNGNSNSASLISPTTGNVGSGVPTAVNANYTAPKATSGNMTDSYYQSITQQVSNLSAQLENERQRQLETIQRDKDRAQEELQNTRDMQGDAINEQGALSIEEKNKKLEALDLETKRFDENYKIVQGLASQLMDLTTQGNALIASEKSVTGLNSIRNPRVQEAINSVTAATGVIKAGIDVYNGQMNQAQNQLQTTTATLTSAYSDQIDYYKSISAYYESVAADTSDELKTLTKDEQDFLQSKIASLEADKKRVQDTSEAIQNAMIDPDTALAYASAGVTLNDSPAVINQKLAKYGYSKELSEQSSDMASKGYTALVSGNPPAGSDVVRITDSQGGVKTYYKKASGGSSGGNALSILDVQRYQEAFPDAGITAGDTEATANAKVNASNNPQTETKDLIQAIKDNGTSFDDVVKEINADKTITDKAGAIAIAKEVYGITGTSTTKDKYAPVGDTISADDGTGLSSEPGLFNSLYNVLFN